MPSKSDPRPRSSISGHRSPVSRPTKAQLQRALDMANEALQASLAVSPERDNNFFTGGLSSLYDSRNNWDRRKVFAESLRAWRVNPIARRIVKLMTSFAIGKGIRIKSDDPAAQAFLDEWTAHPLNQFKRNVKRWKDEDTRTGNLFFLFTVQPDGMSIIRAVPAEQIDEIETTENDIEQETRYLRDQLGAEAWPAYQPGQEQKSFMVHFASNQPVGSPWGEADLSPLLSWIGRYAGWLENRARLNQYRTAFLYVMRSSFASEAERATRQAQVNANPPTSGSVLVLNSNNGEDWGVLSAQLDAFDASMDGIALKKMILDGIGQPMHWHAEPEGATQTTAEAAGTPTFRSLEEMQDDFFQVLISLATIALQVKGIRPSRSTQQGPSLSSPQGAVPGHPSPGRIWVEGTDITERDNATLALALGRAYPNLADMFDREAIDAAEFLRLTYKTFAETWTGPAPNVNKKPLTKPVSPQVPSSDNPAEPTDPNEPA